MSALTLTLKHRIDQRVDMSALVCNLVEAMDPAEIGAMTLQSGKCKIKVDELFQISGSDANQIVIKNSYGKLDYIGKELDGGSIRVEGDVGAYLGLGMRSGSISVLGDTGLFTACEMKNGFIEIDGNAGDLVGAALPGNKQGMKGGTVLVRGNIGERAGDHMRRGYILVEGNAGDYCGSRMTAGTIAVMGETGKHLGYAMRRGTLLLWNQPDLPAYFNDCGSHTLAFLPIMFASFRQLNSRFAEASAGFNRAHRYAGDMSETGRGEVLVKI